MSPASPTDKKKPRSTGTTPAKREKNRPTGKGSERRAAEAEQESGQGKKSGTKLPLGTRIRARMGQSGAGSLLLAVRVGLMSGVALLSYLGAMFVAVTVVPNIFLIVSNGTNVGPSSPFELQLAYWLSPSLFLIGLVFVLVLVAVRWLWRAQRNLGERARRALSGEASGQRTP